MPKFVAFLRAINVGGNCVVTMADLAKRFTALKLSNVQTYIQSGNVIFESAELDVAKLAVKIERAVSKGMAYPISTFLRGAGEVRAIAQCDPFKGHPLRNEGKFYVCLLHEKPAPGRVHALEALSSALELYKVIGREAYVVLTAEKNARVKFSGNLVEKTLAVRATGRNHNVICKIAEML